MQNKKDIIQTILSFAKSKTEIRLVLLQGSRANVKARKDRFQDYDIAFFMQDIEYFKNNTSWLKNFGKVLFIQKPEDMELYLPDLKEGWFSFLVLFNNGIRIDFMLIPLQDSSYFFEHEKLAKVLLDKDNIAPQHSPSDEDFYIKPLNHRRFKDCINEFYFLYSSAYKGILRKEALYVNFYLNALRENLFIMLAWQVGLKVKRQQKGFKQSKIYDFIQDFDFSLGKHYKLLPYFLSKKVYQKLLLTYHLGGLKQGLKALHLLDKLFFKSMKSVAKIMYYDLPDDRKRVNRYCKKLKSESR